MPPEPGPARRAPVAPWLRGYRVAWLRADALAGLSTAAVVIPMAIAYAAIAGIPIEAGLCTAVVPTFVYALLGTSTALSVSSTTTIAILTGAAMAIAAPSGTPAELLTACATLSVLVGAMLAAAAVLRLGFLANFISEPVLTGFKAGVGIVIVADQVPKLLGVAFPKGTFLGNLRSLARHVSETSPTTLAVGVAALALLEALRRFLPKAPAPLLAVALGIAASAALGLESHGVAVVGAIPAGLPAPRLPDLELLEALWPAAAGIALMSFTETIASGRAFVAPGEPRPGANLELLATGLATVGGGIFAGMPAGGGTSQTAVNRAAGARTQAAGLFTAATALATLFLLGPVLARMPKAVLGAVVVANSARLVKVREFAAIRRLRRLEFRWALAACVGVVLVGTLKGILVAVVVSLLTLAMETRDPPVYALGRKRGTHVFRPLSPEHPTDETFPGLLLVRTEGLIYFANAQRAGEKFWPLIAEHRPRVLVIDCSAVTDFEYSALQMLTDAERRLARDGIALWLAALNPEVLALVGRSPLGQRLGRERMVFNLDVAVERFEAQQTARAGDAPARA